MILYKSIITNNLQNIKYIFLFDNLIKNIKKYLFTF